MVIIVSQRKLLLLILVTVQLIAGLYCALCVSMGGTKEGEDVNFYWRARVTKVSLPKYAGRVRKQVASLKAYNFCFDDPISKLKYAFSSS